MNFEVKIFSFLIVYQPGPFPIILLKHCQYAAALNLIKLCSCCRHRVGHFQILWQ